MEFLGSVGIDVKLLFAQVVNFGLLLWLLSVWVYRPILRRIEEDEHELLKVREQQEALNKEKDLFEREKHKAVSEAKKHAEEIIYEAEAIAKGIRERAQKETDQERQAVVDQIKARLADIENAK